MCANGHNNSQHCWPNNVGSCCVHLHMAKSLISFKLCATTPNNTQQHCNNIATTCNRVCQWTQHVTFNNVESCWPTMLHPFARGCRMKRPYRGVCMEGFDHILGDNFVIILIKGNVDKPIFFVYIRQTKWFATGRSFVCCKYNYHLISIKNSVNICRLLYCSFFCPHKAFKIFGKRWISS